VAAGDEMCPAQLRDWLVPVEASPPCSGTMPDGMRRVESISIPPVRPADKGPTLDTHRSPRGIPAKNPWPTRGSPAPTLRLTPAPAVLGGGLGELGRGVGERWGRGRTTTELKPHQAEESF
jgi:hypothetical protein